MGGEMHCSGAVVRCRGEMRCNTTALQGLRCFYLLLQRICSKKQRCAMLAEVMMHRCNVSVGLGVDLQCTAVGECNANQDALKQMGDEVMQCIYVHICTLPRRGMYWVVNPQRPKDISRDISRAKGQ